MNARDKVLSSLQPDVKETALRLAVDAQWSADDPIWEMAALMLRTETAALSVVGAVERVQSLESVPAKLDAAASKATERMASAIAASGSRAAEAVNDAADRHAALFKKLSGAVKEDAATGVSAALRNGEKALHDALSGVIRSAQAATDARAVLVATNAMEQAAAALKMRAVVMPTLLGMLTLALVFLAGAMFNAVVLPLMGWLLVAVVCTMGLLSVVWSESGSKLFRLWATGGWGLVIALALLHTLLAAR